MLGWVREKNKSATVMVASIITSFTATNAAFPKRMRVKVDWMFI